MIPNAVATTGPYANLWSHLKSILHSIDRVLHADSKANLADLDKDRLQALIRILRGALDQEVNGGSLPETNFSAGLKTHDPIYCSGIDLRQRISSVPAFDNWQKQSRKGFEVKVQRLIKAAQDILTSSAGALFAKDAPREEFEVLRAIVFSLMLEAETQLQH